MNVAIVTAAGKGIRFGGRKALQMLGKRTLLAWSIKPFEDCKSISEVVVTIPAEDSPDLYQEILRRENFGKVRIINGGETRYESSAEPGPPLLP